MVPIAHCSGCGAPLRGGASLGLCPACAVRGALGDDWSAAAEDGPHRFGAGAEDYELLDEIARGGMGVVYRARQRRLGRIVALKVLLGGAFAGDEGRRRLQTEAAAAARLVHPNIVAVHDSGEIDGQPYYSMEYVAGRTLAEEIRKGPLPAGRAARYLAAIADAVQHAHEQGVLHRDLKPSNVLLDADGRPRVTDFGLAKAIPSTDPAPAVSGHRPLDATLTLTGQVLGSPAYMAPEQAFPGGHTLGPTIDVYSLGSILYELLVARPPFQGPTPQAVLTQLREVDPVPPRRLDSSVPVDLETICLKCLEKDPFRRYASARDLSADLHRFLRGEPVYARPVGWAGRAWRWTRRRPTVAGLGMSLAATLIVGAILLATGANRLRQSRNLAQERLAESLLSEARARLLAQEPGYRQQVLDRIEEARRLDQTGHQVQRLRKEAIAALARTDIRKVTATRVPACLDMMLMAFDPRFELCAVGDGAGVGIAIYRVSDGTLLRRLPIQEPDEIVGFDHSGRYLALRYGTAVALWSVEDGRCLLSDEDGDGNGFNSGAFSPDGRWFGRAERGGRFTVYRLSSDSPASVQQERTWPLPGGRPAGEVRWSNDATALAMTQAGDWLTVCDATSGSLRWEVRRPDGLSGLAWIPCRNALAVGTGRDSVILLSATNGEPLGPAGVPIHTAECLAASPDGARLAVATERFGTRLLETGSGRPTGMDPRGAWHLHFDTEGLRVGTLFDQGRPAWLEILESPILRRIDTGPIPPESVLQFTKDGTGLQVLARDGVQFWQVADGRRQGTVLSRKVVGMALAEARKRLYLTRGGDLLGIRLEPGYSGSRDSSEAQRLASGQRFWGVAVAEHRGWIAVADLVANKVKVLNLSGAAEREYPTFPAPGYVAFSVDEHWLACGGGNHVMVWDLDSEAATPIRHFTQVGERVRFSSHGRWLINEGSLLRLWRTGSWEVIVPKGLEPNNALGFAAAFSPDERWLAATQHDREIHLIDAEREETFAILEGPGEGRVSHLAFSPDGRRLAATRDRGEVQVWDLTRLREELQLRHLSW